MTGLRGVTPRGAGFGRLLFLLAALGATEAAATQQAGGQYEEIPVEGGATLTGQVFFDGDVPSPRRILITRDMEICGDGYRERSDVRLGEGGGLSNVVIVIEGIEAGKPWPEGVEATRVNQEECAFTPHVQVVRRGSDLDIVNSDPILHNIHGYERMDGGRRTLFNLGQPEQGTIRQMLRTARSSVVSLECDAHDFMLGWIWAAETPYAVEVDESG